MKIEVNITKKYAFAIIASLVILAGIVFVVAQAQTAQNPGHNINEIDGIPVCASGEVLTTNSLTGLFECVTDQTTASAQGCTELEFITRTSSDQTQNVEVHPDCIGKICRLMLIAEDRDDSVDDSTNTEAMVFDYIQAIPGLSDDRIWHAFLPKGVDSPGGLSSGSGESETVTDGRNGLGSATVISEVGSVTLYDDKSGVETSQTEWLLEMTSDSSYKHGALYLC